MMTDWFRTAFRELTDFEPFPWQERLWVRLVQLDVPPACDIPTGLGKTSVLVVWLLALARRLGDGVPIAPTTRLDPYLPRRLIYVVNRRTIVDQATSDAEKLRARLATGKGVIGEVRQALSTVAGKNDEVLALSTLRGAHADNGAWREDPARPAIIVGTVDMIGSKLLFSGYGSSYKMRPREAGLLGQDALYVHDEAHLTPRFGDLLRSVRNEQDQAGDPRPLRLLELSATGGGFVGELLALGAEDLATPEIQRRVRARKRLELEEVEDVPQALAQRALEFGAETPCRVIVFVRSPEDAVKVERAIRRDRSAADRTITLTGTMRGQERDRLAESEAFRAFAPSVAREPLASSLYLIATSAGEVGVNIDGDHCACDMTTLDGMIQRLGRVNRLGRGDARVTVAWTRKDGKRRKSKAEEGGRDRIALTAAALGTLPLMENGMHDASPQALRALGGHTEAFAPAPRHVPATDVHFDRWAATSVLGDLPGREPVAPFLHGISDEPPETHVAWRGELEYLIDKADELQRFGDRAPLHTRELLRDTTWRVATVIGALAVRDPDMKVAVVEGGVWRRLPVPSDPKALARALAWKTVVLPSRAGGLSRAGLLDAEELAPALDVGDEMLDGYWERLRLVVRRDDEERWTARPVPGCGDEVQAYAARFAADDRDELIEAIARESGCVAERIVPVAEHLDEDADEALCLFLRRGRALVDLSSAAAPFDQTLGFHLGAAERHARDLGARAALGESLETLAIAARWHDRGKDRIGWQRAVGNAGAVPLAKTRHGRFNDTFCGKYRHELGSVHDALADEETRQRRDAGLLLQLIASHHGRARPHFERHAFDPAVTSETNERVVLDGIERYWRAQRHLGRWGLAWLEALLHAADVQASVEREGEP